MVKVSKATMATIKRFPELYRRQCLQVIRDENREYARVVADCFVMASMLVLIEEFEWSTDDENDTRLATFLKALQEQVDSSADFYEDAVREGLHHKLEWYGLNYDMEAK